jgi:hypothetical protein
METVISTSKVRRTEELLEENLKMIVKKKQK